MKILAIECSASPVSAAIYEDGKILSYGFSNIKVTHSETLMPMVDNILKFAKLDLDDIDCFAIANGPGSFTGVRIGISAVKGLATPDQKPCAAVSTLYAMAKRFTICDGIICPVMDARCKQVYNALFKAEKGKITRLTEDRAISCEELKSELKAYNKTVYLCGDGCDVFSPYVTDNENVVLPTAELKYQSAVGVAAAAEELILDGKTLLPSEILPMYLRLPQAERELKIKQKKD